MSLQIFLVTRDNWPEGFEIVHVASTRLKAEAWVAKAMANLAKAFSDGYEPSNPYQILTYTVDEEIHE